ncbi:hypothetical protein CMI42_06110 [Candidatus Pacearchaeota archaeon]|nr:hypothetical protein [Candidatus Pacearchaeota archaeon]|tara:strand:- start:8485 stop:9207 length:723 start_codon:yes stop_codon:yes gene_type:complete
MNNHNLEEGEIVLCTVDKILGTIVFVKIENGAEGTITTSEISPGRIRNLRDYVVPGKKIVCKILRIQGDKIYLSLRRVKQQEKKELLDRISKEKSYKSILKTTLKEKADKIIKEITEDYSITDFFETIKEEPKTLEKYLKKDEIEKITKILESKKDKDKEIKQLFKLSTNANNGILKIKKIIKDSCKDTKCKITYLAAGKYRINIKGDNFKEIKQDLNKTLQSLEKSAKKEGCEFGVEKG